MRVDQFQAATAPVGPRAPTLAVSVTHFVDNDEVLVRQERVVRPGQHNPFAAIGELAVVVTNCVAGVQHARICCYQFPVVLGDYEILARAQDRAVFVVRGDRRAGGRSGGKGYAECTGRIVDGIGPAGINVTDQITGPVVRDDLSAVSELNASRPKVVLGQAVGKLRCRPVSKTDDILLLLLEGRERVTNALGELPTAKIDVRSAAVVQFDKLVVGFLEGRVYVIVDRDPHVEDRSGGQGEAECTGIVIDFIVTSRIDVTNQVAVPVVCDYLTAVSELNAAFSQEVAPKRTGEIGGCPIPDTDHLVLMIRNGVIHDFVDHDVVIDGRRVGHSGRGR